MYEAPPGLYFTWTRCQDEAGHPIRILDVTARFRHTPEPLSPGSSFVYFAHPYDQIHIFRARANCEDRVFVEHLIRRRNHYGFMHCWHENKFFSVPAQICSALYPRAPDDWRKDKREPLPAIGPDPVVCVYYFHHLLRNSGSSRRLRDIFRTVTASEMILLTNMALLEAVYYGMRMYPCVLDLRLYPVPDS